MNLSNTLRSPLDQYVDDYFGSKVKDLATAFNLLETEIVHVLEFGCREIKRAPSRRSSASSEREPEKKPPAPKKKTIEKCAHSIKGVNPRVCGKGANYSCNEKWYCKPHLKIYAKKVRPRKEPAEKSIAKKIWKKKTLENKP